MLDSQHYVRQTKNWLSTVVIDLNLCPFAKREFDAGRIAFKVIAAGELHRQLEGVILECAALDADTTVETSLLILPEGLSEFANYLEMLALANALLAEQGYEGIYQLASFHPDYCFKDVRPDDASHYTNRSPYPMVHILREASVEAALQNYPHPEKIPERNVALTQELGIEVVQDLLAACYK